MKPRIAIVGEYYESFEPHTALNASLDTLRDECDFTYEWVETLAVEERGESVLKGYSGIWSAPGSPFKSLQGALEAITYARTNDVPHLGTCAGFQHAIIEIARNLLGVEDAQHEEYDTQATRLFVSRMECSLAGRKMDVYLKEGSLAHRLYKSKETQESYYCNFGINPAFKHVLKHPEIVISGVDQDDEIRIIEIPQNRYFVVTLFVPQTRSLPGAPHPLIRGFVQAACSTAE